MVTEDALRAAGRFALLAGSKNTTQLTPEANAKMVEACWVPTYEEKYSIRYICETYVFPSLKLQNET